MTEAARTTIPRPALTAEQAARRDVFATACMVMQLAKMADLVERGIVAGVGGWRAFQFRQLDWVASHCALAGDDALPFDAFWLFVEEQHAALQAEAEGAIPSAP